MSSDSSYPTMKFRVRVWHDDHDTYHYEYRDNTDRLELPYHRNKFLIGLMERLNPRGFWYKFFYNFLEFDYVPEYGLN